MRTEHKRGEEELAGMVEWVVRRGHGWDMWQKDSNSEREGSEDGDGTMMYSLEVATLKVREVMLK